MRHISIIALIVLWLLIGMCGSLLMWDHFRETRCLHAGDIVIGSIAMLAGPYNFLGAEGLIGMEKLSSYNSCIIEKKCKEK